MKVVRDYLFPGGCVLLSLLAVVFGEWSLAADFFLPLVGWIVGWLPWKLERRRVIALMNGVSDSRFGPMVRPFATDLLERLRLCETIIWDMADLTRPCQLKDSGKVCDHVPNRIINSNVGCVFRLAMEYVKKYPVNAGRVIRRHSRRPKRVIYADPS